jgi:hypothetical protein
MVELLKPLARTGPLGIMGAEPETDFGLLQMITHVLVQVAEHPLARTFVSAALGESNENFGFPFQNSYDM